MLTSNYEILHSYTARSE